MVFRRRMQSLRPINRIKHVVDSQQAGTAGANVTVTLIKSVDTPVLANTNECVTGSKVNGIYLDVEAYGTSAGALSNLYLYIWKNPGGNLTRPGANSIGASDNKRYVIHQEMVMFQKVAGSNPRTVFKGVIAIPRGYRRNGPEDILELVLLAPGISFEVCVQAHYKEFR